MTYGKLKEIGGRLCGENNKPLTLPLYAWEERLQIKRVKIKQEMGWEDAYLMENPDVKGEYHAVKLFFMCEPVSHALYTKLKTAKFTTRDADIGLYLIGV